MKLYIPRIGDKIKLIENWNASIHSESRNERVFDALGIALNKESTGVNKDTIINVIIPKGTVLSFSRIYLRSPASTFDSITFVVVDSPIKKLIKTRFWVKATDASQIEFEHFIPNKEEIVKFNELYKFTANELGYTSQQQLNNEQISEIFSELIKEKEPINVKLILSKNELIQPLVRAFTPYQNLYNPLEQLIENFENTIDVGFVPKEIEMNIKIYPALDRWIVVTDEKWHKLYRSLNKVYDVNKNKFRSHIEYELEYKIFTIDFKKERLNGLFQKTDSKIIVSFDDKEVEINKFDESLEKAMKKLMKPSKKK